MSNPLYTHLRRLWLRYRPRHGRYFDYAAEKDIYYCYRLLLHREPDPAGLQMLRTQVLDQGITIQALVDGFLNCEEFLALRQRLAEPQLVSLPQFQIYARPADYFIGGAIIRDQVYEPHITRLLTDLLRPGHTFIDVGANIGYFTLLAAALVGEPGRVIAFEPNPQNCELLRRSIAANAFGNITLHQNAVAETEAEFLFDTVGYSSNGRLLPGREAGQPPGRAGQYPVQAVTLDHALSDLAQIDVIKIDAEGSEPRVLAGMATILARHRPIILTEFAPTMIEATSQTAPLAYLQQLSRTHRLHLINDKEGIAPTPLPPADLPGFCARLGDRQEAHADLIAYPA